MRRTWRRWSETPRSIPSRLGPSRLASTADATVSEPIFLKLPRRSGRTATTTLTLGHPTTSIGPGQGDSLPKNIQSAHGSIRQTLCVPPRHHCQKSMQSARCASLIWLHVAVV